jgi:hypothetical protein
MVKQEETEKLAEIQLKMISPAMENNENSDLIIKIRDGRIVYCEKRGIKLERITFTKIVLDI